VSIPSAEHDPVLMRRRQIGRWAAAGQRTGYGLFGVACVAFFVGLRWAPTLMANIAMVCLVVGSVVLLPAIIAGYAVRAADREDREQAQAAAARSGADRRRTG
jgi:hypothetical protein